MVSNTTQPYLITNEYNMSEIIAHFDSNMMFDIINDKLNSLNYVSTLEEPNMVASFEDQFKLMQEQYPGDSQNIRMIREQIYREIIDILCNKFNLAFNNQDETIDIFTTAYYLYDFLISNRNYIMINFYTAFIINNKDSLYNAINLEVPKTGRDISSNYAKRIYNDNKYILLAANMHRVLDHIATLDISLLNIFQSTYIDYKVVQFLDNAIADRGNFFKDIYCNILNSPEMLPIIITNIKLQLQKTAGSLTDTDMDILLNINNEA